MIFNRKVFFTVSLTHKHFTRQNRILDSVQEENLFILLFLMGADLACFNVCLDACLGTPIGEIAATQLRLFPIFGV
jgi:hypothetical protein